MEMEQEWLQIYRDNTARVYARNLDRFAEFLDDTGVEEASSEEARAFITYLTRFEQLKPASIRSIISACTAYYTYYQLPNPFAEVARPGAVKQGQAGLDITGLAALLDAPDRTVVGGARDYAMLLTVVMTNLRCAHISRLRKVSIANLPGAVHAAISTYLQLAERWDLRDKDWVFVSERYINSPLSAQWLRRMVRTYADHVGLEGIGVRSIRRYVCKLGLNNVALSRQLAGVRAQRGRQQQ